MGYLYFTDGTKIEAGTMYGIGRNYSLHAKEMGGEVPEEPVIFIKPPCALLNNAGKIIPPIFSQLVHHEVELVAVIGKTCHNVAKSDVADYIAGFAVGIDVTLRDIQNKAKQKGEPWAVAKGFATSAPISEVIPFSEFSDPDFEFELELKVNNETRQRSTTKKMERQVSDLIQYLSGIFILERGDCIFTGTPEGVGPLKPGDEIRAELTGYAQLKVFI